MIQREVHAVFARIVKTFTKVKVHGQKAVTSNPQTNIVNLVLTGLAMLPFPKGSILVTCGYYPQDFTKHSPITSLRLTLALSTRRRLTFEQ